MIEIGQMLCKDDIVPFYNSRSCSLGLRQGKAVETMFRV